jgi:hypothetical protein
MRRKSRLYVVVGRGLRPGGPYSFPRWFQGLLMGVEVMGASVKS